MQWPKGERPRSPISLSLPISRLSNPPRILSRPYFDLKAKLNQNLDDQKRQVEVIEETIAMTKRGYSDSLRELEKISEEIREMDELGDGQAFPPSADSNSPHSVHISLGSTRIVSATIHKPFQNFLLVFVLWGPLNLLSERMRERSPKSL